MIVTIPKVGEYGVIKDLPSQELPVNAWSDAANIRFREGSAERFRGEQRLFDVPTVTPYWLQQYNQGGKRWWVHAGTNALFADDGTSRSTITPSSAPTGGVDDRWTGGVLNGVLVANNGKDVPITWSGSGLAVSLVNWPAQTRVASLRPFKNVLVGLDVTKNVSTTADRYPHMVKWSNAAVPGSLPDSYNEADLTKLAGEIDLAEEPSLMVDALPLGDALIIYKEQSMYAMTATGGQDVFRFQRLPGSVGALAKGCIASTPVGHVVLAPGDVILHDGQGPKSIISSVLRRWLFQTIDSTNRKRAFVVTNPAASEVWICIPELGKAACTLALTWNWESNVWGMRTLPNVTCGAVGQLDYSITSTWAAMGVEVWSDITSAWNQDELSPAQSRLLTASTSPSINAIDVSATFNGAVFTSRLARTGLVFDAPDRVKLIRAVYPRIDAAAGTRIQVEVGGSMDSELGPVWSPPVTYTVGQTFKADCFASGRFLAVRFTSLDNQPWRLRSYDMDVVTQGGY